MVIRVFLDTNILLSFYELSREDNAKLGTIFTLDGESEIKLVVTDHLEREFWRRRASVIATTLKTVGELRLPVVPEMGAALAEAADFNKLKKSLSAAHKTFLSSLNEQIQTQNLFADVLATGIFARADRLEVDPDVMSRARDRVDCGNPPGKKGELGDAVNWELLMTVPKTTSKLVIVTQDRDFIDPLDQSKINSFLEMEWKGRQKGTLIYFSSLTLFLEKFFPDLDFHSFAQVDHTISELAGSGSFAATHEVIAKLSAVAFFSVKQVNYLVQVLSQNSQVHWIFGDADVKGFYQKLMVDYPDKFAWSEFQYLAEMLMYSGDGPMPSLEVLI